MDFIIAFIQNTEDQKKNWRGRDRGGWGGGDCCTLCRIKIDFNDFEKELYYNSIN